MDEIGLVNVLGFDPSLLQSDSFNHSMPWTLGHFQETKVYRPMFKTAEMPVLRECIRWGFYLLRALPWWIYDAICNVDNLVVCLLCYYYLPRPDVHFRS